MYPTFHWTQGLYVARVANGAVRIVQHSEWPDMMQPKIEGATLDVTIPAAEWASIVSFVSKAGEPANYPAAVALHGG